MKNVIVSLVAVAGVASAVNAQTQPPMEPVGATFKYEVALPGGAWGSSVDILPGQRVEWRAVVTYTGSETNAAGLGQVYYQPIFNNVDNAGANQDNLGTWRNNGISGQGNTTLQQGLLSVAEGADSSTLASYGRVRYGFTSRSTTAGSSGGLTGIRHSGGSAGAPAGEFLRVAGSGNPNWYPANIPNGTVDLNNQILWGVVSDNNTATSTWYTAGTQNVVIFRQAFIASADDSVRSLTLTSESATLRRAGGGAGTDDTRSMLWARTGEAGSTGTIRVGVQYIPATINIIPTPGAAALLGLGGLVAARRRRA